MLNEYLVAFLCLKCGITAAQMFLIQSRGLIDISTPGRLALTVFIAGGVSDIIAPMIYGLLKDEK